MERNCCMIKCLEKPNRSPWSRKCERCKGECTDPNSNLALRCPVCSGRGWLPIKPCGVCEGMSEDEHGCTICSCCKGTKCLRPLIPDIVIRLAEAMEQGGAKCERCKGKGTTRFRRPMLDLGPIDTSDPPCMACSGTGRTGCSAQLHDALEEAGLPELAEHFKITDEWNGRCVCERCGFRFDRPLDMALQCPKCKTEFVRKERVGEVHPKGCWALDLIIEKQ